MKKIEVVISAKGETTVQTTGYAGPECLEASKWLETAIGTVTAERKTSEFFQLSQSQQQEVRE